MRSGRLYVLLAALLTLSSTLVVACGDDDGDDAKQTTAATQTSRATQPSGTIDISGIEELDDGKLTVGSDIAYAPIEFFDDSGKAVGLDIDLAQAMADVLGVEVEFENGGFATDERHRLQYSATHERE